MQWQWRAGPCSACMSSADHIRQKNPAKVVSIPIQSHFIFSRRLARLLLTYLLNILAKWWTSGRKVVLDAPYVATSESGPITIKRSLA